MKKNGNENGVYCPFCNLHIAPGCREIILTKNGKAHLACAIPHYLKTLEVASTTSAGISESRELQNFLIDQAECLLGQKYTKKTQKKLQTVIQLHEELFGQPLKISKLVAGA
ncbi:MAG: hypothetical protein U9R06_01350 [Patescibacteria group bacterium]|nr:hypothetical protein [Patescibacteria group bacterium]